MLDNILHVVYTVCSRCCLQYFMNRMVSYGKEVWTSAVFYCQSKDLYFSNLWVSFETRLFGAGRSNIYWRAVLPRPFASHLLSPGVEASFSYVRAEEMSVDIIRDKSWFELREQYIFTCCMDRGWPIESSDLSIIYGMSQDDFKREIHREISRHPWKVDIFKGHFGSPAWL